MHRHLLTFLLLLVSAISQSAICASNYTTLTDNIQVTITGTAPKSAEAQINTGKPIGNSGQRFFLATEAERNNHQLNAGHLLENLDLYDSAGYAMSIYGEMIPDTYDQRLGGNAVMIALRSSRDNEGGTSPEDMAALRQSISELSVEEKRDLVRYVSSNYQANSLNFVYLDKSLEDIGLVKDRWSFLSDYTKSVLEDEKMARHQNAIITSKIARGEELTAQEKEILGAMFAVGFAGRGMTAKDYMLVQKTIIQGISSSRRVAVGQPRPDNTHAGGDRQPETNGHGSDGNNNSNGDGSAPNNNVATTKVENTETYFRVEGGGSGTKTSQNRITVRDDGSIKINQGCSGQLCVSVGNADHASYYLTNKRPDGTVVVFEVDAKVHKNIMDNAIPQNPIPGVNRDLNAPKIVDPNQPGTALELPRVWDSLLENNSSNARVLTQEEFFKEFGK